LQNIVSLIGLFAKETYDFKEPTSRSHPVHIQIEIFVESECTDEFEFLDWVDFGGVATSVEKVNEECVRLTWCVGCANIYIVCVGCKNIYVVCVGCENIYMVCVLCRAIPCVVEYFRLTWCVGCENIYMVCRV